MVTHSVFYKNKKKKLQYNRYSENNRIGANDDRVYWEKKATKLYHACADCGSEVDKRRAKLGYDVCVMCDEPHAKEVWTGWTQERKPQAPRKTTFY
jgi:ribosomal protein L37AE/L43A